MRYIRKFSNINSYESYKRLLDDTDTPNISLCDTDDEVYQTPKIIPLVFNEHNYVEISGLKWATMNIGATKPSDPGLFFQWADIQGYTADQCGNEDGKKYFGFDDYKFVDTLNSEDIDASTTKKYNDDDELVTIQSEDDAATVNWGGTWRIPTRNDYKNLLNATHTEWIYNYKDTGISGILLIDREDETKHIFFPNYGFLNDGIHKDITNGYYWTNSRHGILCADYFSIVEHDYDYPDYHFIDIDEYGWESPAGMLIRPVSN